MDTFYDEQSTQEMIIGSGEEHCALKMIKIESSGSTSLFAGKTAKEATIVKAVSLPPTSDAAAQHSLKFYHHIYSVG